jgi:Glu-tRNA(Gln) amidotransferase subunit E-like FAD-binding protein
MEDEMIGQYSLTMLCQKYGINPVKLVTKNNNILEYGEYIKIDETLNYLINELKISSINIEKCPSILYLSVDNIKKNILFLKQEKINFSNIETCLHVLSAEPASLVETYNYVQENYGIDVLNKITSVLDTPVNVIKEIENLHIPLDKKSRSLLIASSVAWGMTDLIEIKNILASREYKEHPELFTSSTLAHAKLEDIQKILQSPEYKEHPELFTSQTLAQAKLEDIQKILQSSEYKTHPELFTSTTLAQAKLEDIQKIIQSPEYKEHPELVTSQTLAQAKLEDIQKIIQSLEYKEHPELFTSTTLAHAKLEDIQKIIQSPEFKEHPELFTSETLAHANLEDIQKIIQSPEFKEHPELFTSETLAHANLEDIQKILQSAEYKEHPELFTSTTLAHANLEDIQKILQSVEYNEHPELFTSQTLAHAKLEDIRGLLALEYWQDNRFKSLLSSSIVAKSKVMIGKLPILIGIAERYQIANYLSINFLIKSPSENYALIQFLLDNNIPLIIDGKLNSLFSYTSSALKRKYNVDIKELINKYPFNPEILKDKGEQTL